MKETSLKKKKTHSFMVFKYLFKFKNNLHGTNDFMLTTYCICRKKYIALKENVTQEILAHERLTTIYFKGN